MKNRRLLKINGCLWKEENPNQLRLRQAYRTKHSKPCKIKHESQKIK